MTKRSATQSSSFSKHPARAEQPAPLVVPRLVLVGAVTTLVALGLVMVFSASAVVGLTQSQNPQGEFVHQLLYVLVSVAVAGFVALVPSYRALVKAGPALVLGSAALLALTLLMGVSANGSTRWISLGGFSFQPSEFAKIGIVLCVTSIMVSVRQGKRRYNSWFGGRALLCLVAVFLIAIQPDKGTTFVTLIAVWVIMVTDGYPKSWMMALGFGAIGLYLLLALKDDYSRARLFAVFNPFADETGSGYQLVHGIFAFASGGVLGRGLGMSVQKYAYLPEAHNDFILAVIGEELGLLGVLFVFACFGFLAWAGLKIAERANDTQGRYLAMGCVGLLVGQATLNFAGVLGVAPLTGKAVPFLSAGGSSMLASLIIVGLLINISLRTKLRPTVYEKRRSRFSLAQESVLGPVPAAQKAYAPHLRLVSNAVSSPASSWDQGQSFERGAPRPPSSASSYDVEARSLAGVAQVRPQAPGSLSLGGRARRAKR